MAWGPVLAVVAVVLAVSVVAALAATRGRPVRSRIVGLAAALFVGFVTFAGAAVLGQRHPPPVFRFEGGDHDTLVVLISPDAPRSSDTTLRFDAHCTALVHPDDLEAAQERGPWTTYPGVFPLPNLDFTLAGETSAQAFRPGGQGPTALAGSLVNRAIETCGSPEARALWKPATIEVRGGTDLVVVQALPGGPGPVPAQVDRAASCGVRLETGSLAGLAVRFADAPDARSGMLLSEMRGANAVGWFGSVPEGAGPAAEIELFTRAAEAIDACLRARPDLLRPPEPADPDVSAGSPPASPSEPPSERSEPSSR